VLSFSFTFPATVWSLSGFGAWTSAGLRGVGAAVVAGLALALRRAPLPGRDALGGLVVVAAGCVLGFPLLTTMALESVSAAHSAVVIGLLPLATAAYGALRTSTRLSPVFWAAAAAGAAAVVGFALAQDHGAPRAGDLRLVAALAGCAAGYGEGGRLAVTMPSWRVIAWAVVFAAPVSAAVAATGLAREPVSLGPDSLAGLAYVAGVSQFGGFVLWYAGMARIGVARASQLQLAQPLLTLGWAALILGETVPALAPLTAVAVLGCIAVTQRSARRSASPPRPCQGVSPGGLDRHQVELGIELAQVLRIGGDDSGAQPTREKCDVAVDDVAGSGRGEQPPDAQSDLRRQRLDPHGVAPNKPDDRVLARRTTPDLREYRRRHVSCEVPGDESPDRREHPVITPLERDQGAGVEDEVLHDRSVTSSSSSSRPRADRAQASASGSMPPISSISSSTICRASAQSGSAAAKPAK
jgi:drug/metabolite transporter (DMT)-like permease